MDKEDCGSIAVNIHRARHVDFELRNTYRSLNFFKISKYYIAIFATSHFKIKICLLHLSEIQCLCNNVFRTCLFSQVNFLLAPAVHTISCSHHTEENID
jgi:hypothetical protein